MWIIHSVYHLECLGFIINGNIPILSTSNINVGCQKLYHELYAFRIIIHIDKQLKYMIFYNYKSDKTNYLQIKIVHGLFLDQIFGNIFGIEFNTKIHF